MSRAQQNSSGRLRRAYLAVGVAALLATTACGAGQITQTDSQLPAVNGVNAGVGAIAIRDVQFASPHDGHYAEDGDAALSGALVNTSSAEDTLVDVTSPVAADVELIGDTTLPGQVSLAIGTPGEEFHAEEAAATTTTTTSAAPTTTTGEGETTTTTGTATTEPTTTAPATTGAVEMGKLRIVFKDLREPLYPGRTYPVTFVFAKAGAITVELPIATPAEPRESEAGGGEGGH